MMQKLPRFVAGWGIEASHARIFSDVCRVMWLASQNTPGSQEAASSSCGRLLQCVDELLLGRSFGLCHSGIWLTRWLTMTRRP